MISDEQLRALVKAAKAAARRERSGEWLDPKPDEDMGRVMARSGTTVADYAYPETRRFIAAASPDVVAALVAELLKLRGAAQAVDVHPMESLLERPHDGHQTFPMDAAGEPDV
jgi:hypothetical protein